MTTTSQALRDWRGANSLTQKQAATLLRVSLRTLQEWEQGRQSPDASTAGLLSLALELLTNEKTAAHHI